MTKPIVSKIDLQNHILKKSPLRIWEQPVHIQKFLKNLPGIAQNNYEHADFLFLWDDTQQQLISNSELVSYLSTKFKGLVDLNPQLMRSIQLQSAQYWFINIIFAEKYVAIKWIQPETIRQSQNSQDNYPLNYWYLTNYNIKPMDTHLLFYDSGDVKQFAKGHYVNASLRKLGLDFCRGQLFYDFPVFQLVTDFQKELPPFLSPVRGMMTYTEILAQSSRKNVLLNKWKSLSRFNHLINLNRLRYWELNLFRTLKLKVTDKEFHRVVNWYYQNGREIFQTNLTVDLQNHQTVSASTVTWKDLYLVYLATRFQVPLFGFRTRVIAPLQSDLDKVTQLLTPATQFLFLLEEQLDPVIPESMDTVETFMMRFNTIPSSPLPTILHRTATFYAICDYIQHCEQLYKSYKFEVNMTTWNRFVEREQDLARQVQDKIESERRERFKEPFNTTKKWKPLLERLKKSPLEITHLDTITKLYEEGENQHNCVGGYVETVSNDNCIIFHYVYKTVPHTVEIIKDNQQYQVTQCFSTCNQPAVDGALDALESVING